MTARVPHLPFELDPLIAEAKRRMRRRRYLMGLALVVAAAVATALTLGLRAGQPSRAGVSASRYSGRLYSVADVKRAFAQLGWKLVPAPSRPHGLVVLKALWNVPGQDFSGSATGGIVDVATRRTAVGNEPTQATQGMSYANVTAFGRFTTIDNVRGALSALRWGTIAGSKPAADLIVPGKSIGPFRLGDSRAAVEKAFGPGTNRHFWRGGRAGYVSYFGGRVEVSYEFHDGVYNFVTALSTRSPRYHTSSGIHVGSSMQALRKLFVTCVGKTMCYVFAGPMPDALTTSFNLSHGRVSQISFGSA
jgi:hypothetical protein